MSQSAEKTLAIFIYFALTLAVLLVFWQVRNFDFTDYDDDHYVSENPHVLTGLTFDNVIWAFTTGQEANWHPLTWLSHMLDCQLFGARADLMHLENVFLHLVNTLLLFAILKRMTAALWPSAFVAALFALHPMHVESVAWIAERKDVLSTLFLLLTLAAYVHYVRRRGLSRYLLTIGLFALGLLAKPMLVTLPFLLLLLDYWPLNRFDTPAALKASGRQARKSAPLPDRPLTLYRLIIEKIPFFILSAVSCVITFLVQRSSGAVININVLPLETRVANAFLSYIRYIGKMFWPQDLAVPYPYNLADLSFLRIALCFLLLLVISIFVIRLAQNQKYLSVGWFWFIGTLIPVIGIVQVGAQSLADRYTYIPYVGLFVMIAWGVPAVLPAVGAGFKPALRVAVVGASMVIIITALGICAYRQTSYWKNSLTLFSHSIEVTQKNSVAYLNLGVAYGNLSRYPEAIEAYRQALKIRPDYAEAFYNLGNAYNKLGRNQEALEAFRQAIRIKPNYFEAYYNFGYVYANLGRYPEAIEAYNQALKIKPVSADAYHALGVAYGNLGRYQEAIEALRQAIRIKPDYVDAHSNLGVAYGKLGRYQEAIEAFKQAIAIKPDYVEAYTNLGLVYGNLNRYQEAIEIYRQAIKIKPDYPEAHYELGFACGKLGRHEEEIEAYKQAIRIKPDYADAHYELANALCRQGRLEQALDHFRAAVRLKSDWSAPMNDLAALMAYYPDLKGRDVNEAIRLSGRACELVGYKNSAYLGTLAAAFAAASKFPEAIDTAQKALKIAEDANQPDIKKMIQYHLTFYTRGKPYILPYPQPPPEPNKP